MVQAASAAPEWKFANAGYDVTMCLIARDADLEAVLVAQIRAKIWMWS